VNLYGRISDNAGPAAPVCVPGEAGPRGSQDRLSARGRVVHPQRVEDDSRLGDRPEHLNPDLLYGELAAGGPVTPMGEAVRALIPRGRVTRESVVSALRTACIDPATGELGALR
jgi:hypothetical protein